MVRCFLAINLSTETQSFLTSSIKKWGSQYRREVRWVKPENCHLTLKFLGEVEESLVPQIEKNVLKVATAFSPFEISISAPGVFPNPRYPRVLWLGLKGETGNLGRLQNGLESALEPLGFESEKRAFVPHVTVGRVRGNKGKSLNLEGFLNTHIPSIKSRIKVITFYQSILRPSGPTYRVLSSFPLEGPRS